MPDGARWRDGFGGCASTVGVVSVGGIRLYAVGRGRVRGRVRRVGGGCRRSFVVVACSFRLARAEVACGDWAFGGCCDLGGRREGDCRASQLRALAPRARNVRGLRVSGLPAAGVRGGIVKGTAVGETAS